jgi:predicted DNA-binding WGR domain protein
MTAITLRRIDPARNMRRFYALDVQPELFGGFLLMKRWGRIGTFGRITAERFETANLAAGALANHAGQATACYTAAL